VAAGRDCLPACKVALQAMRANVAKGLAERRHKLMKPRSAFRGRINAMLYTPEGQPEKAERIKRWLALLTGSDAPPTDHRSRLLSGRTDQSSSPDAKSQKEKDAATSTCFDAFGGLV